MTPADIALIFNTVGVLFFLAGNVVMWLDKWGLL